VLLVGYWSASFESTDQGGRYIGAGQNGKDVSIAQSWGHFEGGLESVVRLLQSHGKRVLLVDDVPRFSFDPLLAVRTQAIPARRVLAEFLRGPDLESGQEIESLTIDAPDQRATTIISAIAARTGAIIVNLPDGLCGDLVCRYTNDGVSLYVDPQHLSMSGAAYALRKTAVFE